MEYLKVLETVNDIREVNSSTFHMQTFYEDYIQEFLAESSWDCRLFKWFLIYIRSHFIVRMAVESESLTATELWGRVSFALFVFGVVEVAPLF